jgi:hypothetical protein
MKYLSKLVLLAMAVVLIGRAAEAQGDVDLEDLPPCSEETRCEAPYDAQRTPDSSGFCFTEDWMQSEHICIGRDWEKTKAVIESMAEAPDEEAGPAAMEGMLSEQEVQERIDEAVEGMLSEQEVQERIDEAVEEVRVGMVHENEVQARILEAQVRMKTIYDKKLENCAGDAGDRSVIEDEGLLKLVKEAQETGHLGAIGACRIYAVSRGDSHAEKAYQCMFTEQAFAHYAVGDGEGPWYYQAFQKAPAQVDDAHYWKLTVSPSPTLEGRGPKMGPCPDGWECRDYSP